MYNIGGRGEPMQYYAHISEDKTRKQTVKDHLTGTARRSELFAEAFRCGAWGYGCGVLHDIGKIAIPDAILKKTSRLTDEEYAIMKTHPVWGKKILAGLSFLPQADYGASYHHERYDGKGYPEGIRTDDLPYIVRIISAADALDAMNSNRCYRKQCSRNYIISEFEKGSGTQFDPEVAETVIYLIEEGKIEIPEGENA